MLNTWTRPSSIQPPNTRPSELLPCAPDNRRPKLPAPPRSRAHRNWRTLLREPLREIRQRAGMAVEVEVVRQGSEATVVGGLRRATTSKTEAERPKAPR